MKAVSHSRRSTVLSQPRRLGHSGRGLSAGECDTITRRRLHQQQRDGDGDGEGDDDGVGDGDGDGDGAMTIHYYLSGTSHSSGR